MLAWGQGSGQTAKGVRAGASAQVRRSGSSSKKVHEGVLEGVGGAFMSAYSEQISGQTFKGLTAGWHQKERKNFACRRALRKDVVRRKTCPDTLPPTWGLQQGGTRTERDSLSLTPKPHVQRLLLLFCLACCLLSFSFDVLLPFFLFLFCPCCPCCLFSSPQVLPFCPTLLAPARPPPPPLFRAGT